MNKYQKEVEKIKLDLEKETLDKLQKTYVQATKDVKKEINRLYKQIQDLIDADVENKTLIRSKVYQLKYQTAILENLKDTFKVLSDENVDNVGDFLSKMYDKSYLGQIYNLHKQDIPVYLPLNHKKLAKAVYKDIDGMKFSKRLYKDVDKVKREVIDEISRGIASGFTVDEISVNIADSLGVSMRKAYQIARTEGGRVSTEATYDSIKDSIDKGADLVKVWDSTLDKKTRPHHRELDGQYAEVDEPFKYSGGEVQAPHQFGKASEDVNCRCALLSSPRWDVEEEYTKRDNITGETIKAKNYEDWAYKYHKELSKRYKAEQEAKELIKKAKAKDKVITKTLKLAVAKGTGELFGLDYRIKSQGSLERKLLSKSKSKGISIEEYSKQVTDVLRYTNVSSAENLADDYFILVDFMKGNGYNEIEVTNTFTIDGMYKGINTLMQDKDGYVFELQYHTQQSIDIKEVNHKLYEEWRLDTTSIQRKNELAMEMMKNAQSIIIPKNANKIKNKK